MSVTHPRSAVSAAASTKGGQREEEETNERKKAPRRDDASSLPLSVQKEIAQHFLAPIGTTG